jgi:hypothetical protein
MTTTVTVTDHDSPLAMSDILAHRPVFKNGLTSSPTTYSTSANLCRHSYKTISYLPSSRPCRAPLIVREARDEDATSIATIRYAAYFPQPGHAQAYGRVPFADHVYFDGFNTQQFIANSASLHAKILVVEDTATKEIISTANWFLPVRDGETAIDPSCLTKLNPSCRYLNLALLTTYNDSIETVEQATWKGKRCYRMLLPRQRFHLSKASSHSHSHSLYLLSRLPSR